MTVWFTSDTHFGHANVIKHCNRPFQSSEEMTERLIEGWNLRVKGGDTVYHLGDFSMKLKTPAIEAILRRLKGQKFLITGNHDQKEVEKAHGFIKQTSYKRIKIGDQKIILFHYAMRVWDQFHRGSWQLHGHSHGSLPVDLSIKQIDVGVDCRNYMPMSFEEVAHEMDGHGSKSVDHHGRRIE